MPIPNEAIKYFIPYIIYLELNMNEDAQRCGTLAYRNAKDLENISLMSIILSNEASRFQLQGRIQEALQYEYEGLKLTTFVPYVAQ